MTKEELKTDESKYIIELVIKDKLKKEAEEWLCNNLHSASEEDFIKAMVDIAEPREKQIQIDAEQIRALQKQNGELTDKVKELKILISSLVYEINQIWDINEMDDDLQRSAEKIDREVQLSKMAEDNRIVISALGFAIVPPKPKLDVKEIKEK